MNRIISRFRHSGFSRVFNFGGSRARGRCVMLGYNTISACSGFLTGGVFYTGFLAANDIDIVDLGIISFLPLLANLFSIFAPLILERFPKRRWLIVSSRFLSYTISILGITLLPSIVTDKAVKVICFGAIVFVAQLFSALADCGTVIWHLQFIPDDVRTEYFSYQQIISTTISSSLLLVSSLIADAVKASSNQLAILYTFRIIGYVLAVIAVVIVALPKEYPYPQKEVSIRLKNVFTLPFQHKKYLSTMALIALWTLNSYFTSSTIYYYLLQNVGATYTFINFIDASYAVFLIFFSPCWRRYIRRNGYFYTVGVTAMLHCPTTLLYAFITPGNHIWLMLVVRMTQHLLGAGLNLAWANMPFINMPPEDQTNYQVFYSIVTNVCAMIGLVISTSFISMTRNWTLTLFGRTFESVPLLLFAQGVGQLLIGSIFYFKRHKLAPAEDDKR